MDEKIANAVCVYCSSSSSCDPKYHAEARELGRLLARDGRVVIYGGSRIGSMGALADGALAAGGRVIGVLPRFLQERERSHARLTELHVVDDMRIRKQWMLSRSAAVIALPGGCGTFDELLEAVTLKRLGLYHGPIVLVNSSGYFDALLSVFDGAVRERFMDAADRHLWHVVADVAAVLPALPASTRPAGAGRPGVAP